MNDSASSVPDYLLHKDDFGLSAYITRRDPGTWDRELIGEFDTGRCFSEPINEMLRRANALPAVEARLEEAADIIRRAYAQSQEAEPGCTCDWCREMRAFLEMNGGVE